MASSPSSPLPPTPYRRPVRGRPALGFLLDVPAVVTVRDGQVATFVEVRGDGRVLGELELSVFGAALIIDRNGILAEKAREAATRALGGRGASDGVPVRLPGASGYRAEGVRAGDALPYVFAFTFAPHDLGVDGGVLAVLRAQAPDWPAGEQMLHSLRLLRRNGTVEEPSDTLDEEYEALLPLAR